MLCSNSDVTLECYEDQFTHYCHNSLGFGCGVVKDMYNSHVVNVEKNTFVRQGIAPGQYCHIDWEQFQKCHVVDDISL